MFGQPISTLVGFSKGVLESNVPFLGCQIPDAVDEGENHAIPSIYMRSKEERKSYSHVMCLKPSSQDCFKP